MESSLLFNTIIKGVLVLYMSIASPFTVVVDSLQVVQYTFPLIEFDSSDYTCNIKYTSNKMIEIQWVNVKNRLFLRKEITSVN